MAGYTVPDHRARVESAFSRAKTVEDLQLQADLARHLCVLVAGYLEQATRHTLGDFAVRKSHPSVARYVERRSDSSLMQTVKSYVISSGTLMRSREVALRVLCRASARMLSTASSPTVMRLLTAEMLVLRLCA